MRVTRQPFQPPSDDGLVRCTFQGGPEEVCMLVEPVLSHSEIDVIRRHWRKGDFYWVADFTGSNSSDSGKQLTILRFYLNEPAEYDQLEQLFKPFKDFLEELLDRPIC